ncbi:MAG: RnfABCDGE type electron transport complex subunit B [Spirochaetota bacterium]|uniref:RnfABCDGE type electron transport complex subunit B n=1 Tax=Rectinema subterraneum TaxID=2653714 RepID=UPI00131B3F0C|nr:RnfABCDGE type electron transport complex subunit B [Rectinema subterraneum]
MVGTILITFGFSAVLALVLGVALGFFREKFKVERDPKIDEVREALPGANCGACGYPGCDGYSEAVATGRAPTTKCSVGGSATAEALAKIMGVEGGAAEDKVAVLLCQGAIDKTVSKGEYNGIQTCRAAKLSTGSIKTCSWSCQGFGDCVNVCKFDALAMGEDGLPHVNYDNCTGCGLCVEECPQKILTLVPRDRVGSIVLCSNRSTVKASVIKTCKVGCIKCELCVKSCPEGAITMVNGIPVTDYAKCTSCGICVEKCPTKCYKMLEIDVFGTKKLVPLMEQAQA